MQNRERSDRMIQGKGKGNGPEGLDRDLRFIAGLVAGLPEAEPPGDLTARIMRRIGAKRISFWKRFWRRMRSPFSLTPLTLVPAGVAAAALVVAVLTLIRPTPERAGIASSSPAAPGPSSNVVFTLDMPEASRVEVIGSFNRWTAGGFQMDWDGKRRLWVLSVRLEGGSYEYAFLVDGRVVVPDPKALIHQEDGFGNKNSVLIVERGKGDERDI
jgi:hypothetical protein